MSSLSSDHGSNRHQLRIDAEFVHGGNQAADVVAENLAQHFILHGHVSLAANRVAKLRFHHAEGRFDVRPLVVVLTELFAAQTEVVERLGKQPADSASRSNAERDEGFIMLFGRTGCGFCWPRHRSGFDSRDTRIQSVSVGCESLWPQ